MSKWTLYQRLGGQDEDRATTEHNLACQYMALEGNARRLAALVLKPEFGVSVMRTLLEQPVSKGRDQYKTTIGFADLVIDAGKLAPADDSMCVWNYCWDKCSCGRSVPSSYRYNWDRPYKCDCGHLVAVDGPHLPVESCSSIVVEVKSSRWTADDASAHEAMRQLKLYGEHYRDGAGRACGGLVLAVVGGVPREVTAALASQGIVGVTIGPAFHEWVKQRDGLDAEVF